MNQFRDLLKQGAAEVRRYSKTSQNAAGVGLDWLEGIAGRMEDAARLENEGELELAIDTIAHLIIDGGPITEEFAPSFDQVLDAVQRKRKRRPSHD
jgi:hypothetical protein